MELTLPALHNRLATLEAATQANASTIRKVGELTRNNLGTLSAAVMAISINIGIGWLHNQHAISAYTWLTEQEQVLATDLGVRIREIIDYDTSRFVAMPAGTVMIGLTPAQTQQWIHETIRTESSGNQYIINQYGYMGIGQFGAEALVAVGLVDRSKFSYACKTGVLRGRGCWKGQHAWLRNPSNWLIDGGMQTFLDNKQLQIKAMITLANLNIQHGYRVGAIHQGDSPQKHGGFAKASHLVGAGNASRWYKYRIDTRDGNGHPASSYARQGERAITS